MRVCFSLSPVSTWLCRSGLSDNSVENVNIQNYKMIWGHLASGGMYPKRLHLTECLSTTDIKVVATCECFRYLLLNWSGVLLTGDMEHIT